VRALLTALLVASTAGADTQGRPPTPALDISVRMEQAGPRLEVEAGVTLPPATSVAASYEFVLDARCGEPLVTVGVAAGPAQPATVVRHGGRLTITPRIPAAAGKAVVLRFRYAIGSHRARSFFVAADAAFISGEAFAWYPRPASARRATGRLRFTLPDGFVVAATGTSERDSAGAAATAHTFLVADPTTFSFAAARHHITRQAGAPPLAVHLLRQRPLVRERLALLRRIVDALAVEFGRYPHPDRDRRDAGRGGRRP
jgi:hypothetical protein